MDEERSDLLYAGAGETEAIGATEPMEEAVAEELELDLTPAVPEGTEDPGADVPP